MYICLYGASSTQISAHYIAATEELGRRLAEAGHTLVYGAGGAGLMGAAARGFKEKDGAVIGVVPHFLQVDGILFDRCDEMIYTETMRERKQVMEERADAFIVTPGGIGTYEEFFEIYTLKQLGRHNKAIVIYNIDGYYNEMLQMLQKTVDLGFMRDASLQLFTVADSVEDVIAALSTTQSDTPDLKLTKYV